MREKDLERILKDLGKEVQEEQCDAASKNHEFSQDYQNRKQELLNSLDKKDTRRFRRPLSAAAAIVMVACASLTVYAATKMFSVMTTVNETEEIVEMSVSKVTEDYIPPIEITPEYLPEGYAEWVEGKYSLDGEWGLDGISIFDAGYFREYKVPDVSDYEEMQIGDAKAVVIHKEGYAYPWEIYLFYEETGHVIQIFGCEALAREEMIKVSENITFKEVPEKDPERTHQAFAYEEQEIEIAEAEVIDGAGLLEIGDTASFAGVTDEGEFYPKELQYAVKSINITDTVQTELLTADTSHDLEQVLSLIQEDGTLKPYTRSVSEWNNGALEEIELGTVPVKNVEVVVEVTNAADVSYGDLNMQPMWRMLEERDNGVYEVLYEDSNIPGYTPGDNFRGSSYYGIANDGMAYYFDSSAFIGTNHFYNMSIEAGETKEVHMWFGIPEDLLDQAYLVFSQSSDGCGNFIKIK